MPAFNGAQLIEADISEPDSGVWTATLRAELDDVPSGACTLEIEGVEWKGHIVRARKDFETMSVFCAGGAASLGIKRGAVDYLFASRRTIISALLSGLAISIATTADAAALSQLLQRWHQASGAAGASMTALLGSSYAWRIVRSGELDVRASSKYDAATYDGSGFYEQRASSRQNAVEYSVDAPLLKPRDAFSGVNITHVDTALRSGSLRQVVYA